MPTRVIVASEVRFYREGLVRVLRRYPDLAVVGMAASGDQALELVGQVPCDVALIDIAMPGGRQCMWQLRSVVPQARIVALAVRDDDQDVIASIEAGAHGYVPNDGSLDEVVATVRTVARGETLCSPRVAALLFRKVAASVHATAEAQLTSRERQVTQLLVRGFSNNEIARHLCIEVPTVKNHIHSIFRKLGVRRRWDVAKQFGAGISSEI